MQRRGSEVSKKYEEEIRATLEEAADELLYESSPTGENEENSLGLEASSSSESSRTSGSNDKSRLEMPSHYERKLRRSSMPLQRNKMHELHRKQRSLVQSIARRTYEQQMKQTYSKLAERNAELLLQMRSVVRIQRRFRKLIEARRRKIGRIAQSERSKLEEQLQHKLRIGKAHSVGGRSYSLPIMSSSSIKTVDET